MGRDLCDLLRGAMPGYAGLFLAGGPDSLLLLLNQRAVREEFLVLLRRGRLNPLLQEVHFALHIPRSHALRALVVTQGELQVLVRLTVPILILV